MKRLEIVEPEETKEFGIMDSNDGVIRVVAGTSVGCGPCIEIYGSGIDVYLNGKPMSRYQEQAVGNR